MELFAGLGLAGLGQPSYEEIIAGDRKQITRLRWAFNGDDRDSKSVRGFLTAYEAIVNEMDGAEHLVCSKSISDTIFESVSAMRETADKLVDLSSIKLTAEGRWFTDRDGPDYRPPSATNPNEN